MPGAKSCCAPAGATLCPRRGLTRRLRRRSKACSPMGRSIASEAIRRGCRGHPACSIRQQLCRKQVPRRGMTRRLRRGLGLAVPWGAHTFLSVAKEKCAKESQRHGDSRGGPPRFASRASSCGSPSGCPRPRFASLTRREKALYCPFLKEGVRNVARSMVKLTTFTFVRARAHSFPLSKRARLFPSAAYRRSAPPQLAVGRLTPCGVGCFDAVGKFCGVDEWADFLHPVGGGAGLPIAG